MTQNSTHSDEEDDKSNLSGTSNSSASQKESQVDGPNVLIMRKKQLLKNQKKLKMRKEKQTFGNP